MKKLIAALDFETNDHNKPRYKEGTLVLGHRDTKVLEIAIIIYELEVKDGKVQFTEVFKDQSMIYHPNTDVWKDAPKIVLDLHDKSGFRVKYDNFVGECDANPILGKATRYNELDAYIALQLQDLLKKNYPEQFNKTLYESGNLNALTIVGKNPQFDMSFLNERFPRTAMYADYRVLDVSMIKNVLRLAGHKQVKRVSKVHSTHHAVDDCLAARRDLEILLELFIQVIPDTVEYLEDLIIH